MFRLTSEEVKIWVSQFATPKSWVKMGLRIPPFVFTEHGVVMLASVINSDVAVAASIHIVRAFNRLRRMALTHKDLTLALSKLAGKVAGHDEQFKVIFAAIEELMEPPAKPRKQIGFTPRG